MTRFEIDPVFALAYTDKPVDFGPLGLLAYARTYSRPINTNDPSQGQERWADTVRRVVNGTYSFQKMHCKAQGRGWDETKAQRSAQEMFRRIFEMKFTPPGRGLWSMGTEFVYERGGTALNNCGFVSTSKGTLSETICLIMDLLMHGVGVGADVAGAGRWNIVLAAQSDGVHVVGDSREEWVRAVRRLLDAYTGVGTLPFSWDFSKIRDAGSAIKSFGGVAPGFEPLRDLLQKLESVMIAHVGRTLGTRGVADVVNVVGVCVVAGGIRRSAEILLGDPKDREFLTLKSVENMKRRPWFWASNNSIIADRVEDFGPFALQTAENGEPGYLFRENARAFGRMADAPNWRDADAQGTNPCVTGDTLVMTTTGPRRIHSFVGEPVQVLVDGVAHETDGRGAFVTGYKPVFLITTDEGYKIKATANHEILTARVTRKKRYETWIEAGDLEAGDKIVLNNMRNVPDWDLSDLGSRDAREGWLFGVVLGDGHIHKGKDTAKIEFWGFDRERFSAHATCALEELFGKPYHGHHNEARGMSTISSRPLWASMQNLDITVEKDFASDAILTTSVDFQAGFVRGMFDTDGSVQGTTEKGLSIRLTSVRRQHLDFVQQMLLNFGIVSTVYGNRKPAGVAIFPDGHGGSKEYETKELFELVISRDNIEEFDAKIGFTSGTKKHQDLGLKIESRRRKTNRERFVATVKSVEPCGFETVYDVAVPGANRFAANGIVVHNCGEQTLFDRELCCLVETYIGRHTCLADYCETLKYAYLYAKTVTLVETHHDSVNAIMAKNRRIGTSIAGALPMYDRIGEKAFVRWLRTGYDFIQKLDRTYSAWLGVPTSIKTTSIKPGGTTPLLPGEAPGIHAEHSQFYLKRVIVEQTSPLVDLYRRNGYHVEDSVQTPRSKVITVPVKSTGTRFKTDYSVEEQVRFNVLIQRHWSDNQVSQTVDFDPADGDKIAPLLEKYRGQVKSLSFLPRIEGGAYPQMPNETIDAETFATHARMITPVSERDALSGHIVHDSEERFCEGDKCLLPVLGA